MMKKENLTQSDRYNKTKNQVKNKFTDEQTGSDTPKKTSFKNNFINWLKTLPLDERYLVPKVNAPGLAKKLQDTLFDLQNEKIQQTKKDMLINKRISSKFSKQIIESIILISDGQQFYENIGLDFSYIEQPEKLYELLTSNLPQAQKQMLLTQQYDINVVQLKQIIQKILNCNSKQDFASDIIDFMRSEIFLKFEEKRPFSLEEQKNRKKEFSIFWRNLSEQYKTKILLLHKQDVKSLFNYLNDRRIFISIQQLQKQINELGRMQKNDFCNKIFKCKLRRSLTYINEYYELIYKTWKSQLSKRKQRKLKGSRVQPVDKSTQSQSSSILSLDLNVKRAIKLQDECDTQGKRRRKNRQRRKQSTSGESTETKETQKPEGKLEDVEDRRPKIDFEKQALEKLQSDIQEYSQRINEEANEFYQRRVIAYERVQFMLSMWNIPIKLFGSCASGITIKNSDIDIAVDNSILNYFVNVPENQRLKAALEQLQGMFQQQPWITTLKLIKTAAIPVIKMKVDTSILFTHIPNYEIPSVYLDELNRQHCSKGEIHIDLTIETINKDLQCNHLGIISTDWINKWLRDIKCLHPIVILIKNHLTKTNLNVTYEGGLNTYSMIYQKLENQTQVAKTLKQILKFYVFEFDQKLQGINPANLKQIFYPKLKLNSSKSAEVSSDIHNVPDMQTFNNHHLCKADLQILDPLNNGRNMTRNCYSFPHIKQLFSQIYETCYLSTERQLEKHFENEYSQKIKEWEALTLEELEQKTQIIIKNHRENIPNPFLTLLD